MKTSFQTLIMVALLTTSAMASHITGGEISYRYIGDSTNVDHQYEITLHLFRDPSGASVPSVAQVCYSSSCFNSGTIALNQVAGGTGPQGGRSIPYYTDCANDSTDPNFVLQYIHIYRGVVTLQGKCSDIEFSYVTCCRNHAITNLEKPASAGFMITAELNNLPGPNSSAEMAFPTQKSFCVLQSSDKPFGLNFWAKDSDGDSLYYSLNQPVSGPVSCNTSMTPIPIPFASGHSRTQPLTTHHNVSFNSSNGLMRFSPDAPQVVVLSVKIEEYRYDTTFAMYHYVGSTVREQQTPVLSMCSSGITNLVMKDTSSAGSSGVQLNLLCGDSILEIEFTKNIDCESIAADGSDFALVNSLGQLVPITGASGTLCQGVGNTQAIRLYLHQPVAANDTLTLISRVGSDLNFLSNSCLLEYTSMPSQQVVVSGCSTDVSLNEHLWNQMQLYPNPAHDQVSISFASASSDRLLQLLDINGKVLLQTDARDKEVSIDLSSFPRGMYMVRSVEGNNTEVAQLFKN